MNPRELIAAFEAVAEAPEGVARLRKLILQLAVRGRLVPQDPRDESGAALVASMPGAMARFVAEGLVRKVERYPARPSSSLNFDLPPGWSLAPLGNIALVLDHLREPVKADQREARCAGKPRADLYPYFGATQQQGWIDDYRLDGEFVLLGEDGVPFLDPLRNKAYLVSGRLWVNNHAHVLLGVRYSNAFLLHYLNQFDYAGRVTGTTRAKLTKGALVDIPVPVPPLVEQRRIVARVDELMSLLDRLEAARTKREAARAAVRDSVLAALREADSPEAVDVAWTRFARRMDDLVCEPADIAPLRQTVLQLAVRGRLVRQTPKDVAPNVARIEGSEPFKESELRDGRLYELPKKWLWCRVHDVGVVQLGRQRSPEHHRGPHMVPYLRVANVYEDRLDLADVKQMNFTPEEQEVFRLMPDDVLLNEGQSYELVGRPAIYSGEIPGCCFQNSLLRWRTRGAVAPRFALLVFRAWMHERRFQRHAQQTTNIAHLSAGRLKQIEFPVPPMAEQLRIVEQVARLLSLLDRLEREIMAAKMSHAAYCSAAVHHVVT